ncbi:unnamed protein product, partial [Linum tenue]
DTQRVDPENRFPWQHRPTVPITTPHRHPPQTRQRRRSNPCPQSPTRSEIGDIQDDAGPRRLQVPRQRHDHAAGAEPRGAGIPAGVSVQRGPGSGEAGAPRMVRSLDASNALEVLVSMRRSWPATRIWRYRSRGRFWWTPSWPDDQLFQHAAGCWLHKKQ